MVIFSLIFAIFSSYIIYLCFEYYGFKLTFLITLIFNIISAIIRNGMYNIFLSILITFLVSLITTSIDYFIYNRTNSFISFLLLSLFIGFILIFCSGFILTLIGVGIMSNGILS